MDIEYLGSDWHGWQSQPGLDTVQGAIESALKTVLREHVSIIGAGRTDTGVNASGQVAHFTTQADIDPFRLLASINGITPSSIAVSSIRQVDDGFHARFDARSRMYRYRIGTTPFALESAYRWWVRPAPDINRMNEAANYLIGRHDFTSFCRAQSETENKVCDVSEATWTTVLGTSDHADFITCADRFLHGMVRAIVGTLIEVGHGKREPSEIPALLEKMDRTAAGFAAPALGLTLELVSYDEN